MKNSILLSVSLFVAASFTSGCSNKKNDYPAEITQNFMNSCVESSGGNQSVCACLLEKIQANYTYEEFSAIEVKMQSGQTSDEFLEFVGKARAECTK